MSTAPPGWHRQPDGRDRFWDGQRWTDEFRDPSEATTQQIPLDETRGMPAADDRGGYASQAPGAGSPGQGGQGSYAPPPSYGSGGDAYGQGGPLSDSPRGGSGWLKGCLIALLVMVILAVVVVVAGLLFFRSASESVSESIPTILPTELPTGLPTDVPTELPTDLPTTLPTDFPTELPTDLPSVPGQGESVTAGVGDGFEFGGATIQDGWSVGEAQLGFRTVSMTAVPNETSTVPLLFNLTFLQGDSDIAATVCTVSMGTAGEATDVACVPLRGDVDSADSVRVTGLGG